jgi:hypothetical protein
MTSCLIVTMCDDLLVSYDSLAGGRAVLVIVQVPRYRKADALSKAVDQGQHLVPPAE